MTTLQGNDVKHLLSNSQVHRFRCLIQYAEAGRTILESYRTATLCSFDSCINYWNPYTFDAEWVPHSRDVSSRASHRNAKPTACTTRLESELQPIFDYKLT
jgi:hypothetical protein